MPYRKGITPKTKALALLLRENGCSYSEIARKCHISRTSAIEFSNRHATRSKSGKKTSKRKGRPPKLNQRDKRHLYRCLLKLRKVDPNFTVKKLVEFAGMSYNNVHYRTYVRALHEGNFGYKQTRKKGVLSERDRKRRMQFARKCKGILKDNENFFHKDIQLYLDGVSFVFKTNPFGEAMRPKARVWRKPNEGLDITSKGSKDLAGGKRLHLMVGISYNKGVVIAEPYEHMSGNYFAQFVYTELHSAFEDMEADMPYKFIMDNDPSQTSKLSLDAIDDIGAQLFSIPPRSPDINVIENLFHVFKKKLDTDAIEKRITKESFNSFKSRVINTLKSTDVNYINSLIKSFPKRIDNIILRKGGRTKY